MGDYLTKIIELSKKSLESGDVPIGAIIVKDGKIIGEGYNTREKNNDVMGHAEINAIKDASKNLNNWNLQGSVMYVTLKPCSMCLSVIRESRVDFVYYLLDKPEKKFEYSRTAIHNFDDENAKEEYLGILQDFFKKLREK
ncbi:MAG TPA: nucleoside deaminase [Candidatus Onthocola stercoravium]|nr:nucleoside deaminase [Candidatus Onthocola stercoravium]